MASVSKLEYLRRYMDGKKQDNKVKKKRKKVKHFGSNIKIVDTDITFKDMQSITCDDENEFVLKEEIPVVYAVDGATVFTKEYEENERRKNSRWALLASLQNDLTILGSTKKVAHEINYSIKSQKPRKRHDSSGSDFSPIRKQKKHDSSGDDNSPVCRRRQRHDSSDRDVSPVCDTRQKRKYDSNNSDVSTGHSRKVNLNNSNSDTDLSPIRKRNYDSDHSDLSPLRKRKNQEYDSDVSPKRHHQNTKRRKEEPPEVMSNGRKAGLRTGTELCEENKYKHKLEMEQINKMDSSVSGKGAETVYRDRKSGKKIDLKFEELKKRRGNEAKAKHEEKYATWGKGVIQESDYKKKLQDDLHEMEKPLARYKDDKDLDTLLKKQDRDGDPMLAFLTKKKDQASKPKYNGPTPAPNRFNIWPGYRYDGVDRSNGFEKKRFMEINKRESLKEDAYKWSVEDM